MEFMHKKTGKKIHFKENLKLYYEIAKNYKWLFIGIFALSLVTVTSRLIQNILYKIIVDNGEIFSKGVLALEQFSKILFIISIIFSLILMSRTFASWVLVRLINKFSLNVMYDIKRKFFSHIINLHHGFHTSNKTGSLISKLNRGTRAVSGISDFIFYSVFYTLFEFLFFTSALFYFDLYSGVIVVFCIGSFFIISLYIIKIQQPAQIESNRAEDIEKANLSDSFTNIEPIKYFGKEKIAFDKFSILSKENMDKSLIYWNFHRYINSSQVLINGLGVILIFYFSLKRFLLGEITLGTLVFIYSSFMSVVIPFHHFVYTLKGLFTHLGDLESLYEYDKIKNEIIDKENAQEANIKNGEIIFKDISFNYNKRKIIDKFNLTINPKEKIAFVGHSGSGKTTLIKLLYRFYEVDSGEIDIDKKNVKDFKQKSLRESLSIVPQECILFDDTLYNNILFSNPTASRDQVLKAIKFAQLEEFIKKLPNKENTIVGERGIKLSGGEKQRVSIARAILADKKILVLDEATSSLDSKTEDEIKKGLYKLLEGRTAIVIAHRLSTIMQVDRIVVMDNGKIVQIGKHTDLINKKGVYKELWNLQKGGYIGE